MGKEERRSRIPWNILLSVPPSILAIIVVGLIIITWLEPDLEAIANGGNWKAPLDAEKELEGIIQASNPCKKLMEAIEAMEAKEAVEAEETKETKETNIRAKISKVKDLSAEIIGTIENLFPYEANNVESYTIEVENNGDTTSNRIILEIEDAKYVQYQNHGKERTVTGDFRGDDCRIAPMGRLEPDGRILANAWVICSVSPEGCFKITQEYHGDVPLYMKTPVGRVAAWVNKPLHISLVLVFMLFLVFVSCFVTYRVVMKSFREQKSSGATAEGLGEDEEVTT